MRIAFFHNLPSGGGKRSAHEWIKRMAQKHEVDLYLYDPTAEDFLDMRPFVNRTVVIPGGETGGERQLGRLKAFVRVRRASMEVARRINAGGYDLAFIMQCKVSNTPFVLCYLRLPSLYFCHEPATKLLEPQTRADDGRMAFIKREFIRWIVRLDGTNARHATLICANSLYSCENIYRSYGVYPRLNYLGVDPELFAPQNLTREPMILSIGPLHPNKDQLFIVESVGSLKERPGITFVYNFAYGPADYQARIEQLAQRLGVVVSFVHLASDPDLVGLYNRASIAVYPSRLEPFGFVPLESMSCGTPVVGVAEGGIRETIQHSETGLLTERDPVEFGRAIEMLLKDSVLWNRLAITGRQRVLERWTWEKSYEKLEKHMRMTVERWKC
jgi:glycosyltransferase involved in cell wall biosynthesis